MYIIRFLILHLKLNIVDSYKCLGHIKLSTDNDSPDIIRQMGLLHARTNTLTWNFRKCVINVKLCVFQAYVTQFYGCSTWNRFTV